MHAEPVEAVDLSRPAAVQQLQTLGRQIDVTVLAPPEGVAAPASNVIAFE